MAELLHISASTRGAESYSRRVGRQAVDALCATSPALTVCRRDLAVEPLPHPDNDFVAATLRRADGRDPADAAALGLSERLIGELESAAVVVIDTPMHNFTVPSVLKAWIDYIVRNGRTFGVTPDGKVGFVADRPVLVIAACGGRFGDAQGAQADFLTDYLRYVLGSIGLRSVDVLRLEAMRRAPELRDAQLAMAERWIAARAAALAPHVA
jgi:FMN-dependent NADH-azoreductase